MQVCKRIAIPKFHDRVSIVLGVFTGLFLTIDGIIRLNIIEGLIGLGLTIHMVDTFRLYKKHRIVKIIKTNTERLVYVTDRVGWWRDALKFAWSQFPFRVWVVICTLGITIGLLAGIGMTNLVLLVAIACLGWGMEVANSAVETLCDLIHPDYSPKVKIVKDAFASVPIFCYTAYVISWMILVIPRLI